MNTITGENLSTAEPLTPLNPDEPIRYVNCNLTNRLVHADSIIDNCQESQIIFDGEGEAAEAHHVGVGVRGEVTTADVQAALDAIGGGS